MQDLFSCGRETHCEERGGLRGKGIKKGTKKGILGFEGEDGNSHLAQANPAGLQRWNDASMEETLGWRRFHQQEHNPSLLGLPEGSLWSLSSSTLQ